LFSTYEIVSLSHKLILTLHGSGRLKRFMLNLFLLVSLVKAKNNEISGVFSKRDVNAFTSILKSSIFIQL
jgi:hypothetical protein